MLLLVYSAFFKVCIARWAYLFRWLVDFRPGGVPVSVVGRPVCKPPKRGGTGARVQGRSRRPQAGPGLCKASAGAAWAVVARYLRCTSGGRSTSAACGVRGVRAAQQSKYKRKWGYHRKRHFLFWVSDDAHFFITPIEPRFNSIPIAYLKLPKIPSNLAEIWPCMCAILSAGLSL